MRNLISPDAVAKAVLDLAEPEGPKNVTARALAGELNVSVGALYNYAGSMNQALDSAEVVILGRLAEGLREPKEHPLLAWISDNRGHAELLFDLDRKHRELPPEVRSELSKSISIVDVEHPLAAETVRNFLGMLLADPAGDAVLADVDSWLGPLVEDYTAARKRHDAGERLAVPIDAEALMAEVHAFIDSDANDPVRASVRHETINILSEKSARGWNFRALSSATGLPLARLHMFGTRHDHLSQVAVDLMSAALRLSDAKGIDKALTVPVALASVPEPLLDAIIEVFNLTNLIDITDRAGMTALSESIRDSSAGVASKLPRGITTIGVISMLLAGFNLREASPQSWEIAPNLAALYLDKSYRG